MIPTTDSIESIKQRKDQLHGILVKFQESRLVVVVLLQDGFGLETGADRTELYQSFFSRLVLFVQLLK